MKAGLRVRGDGANQIHQLNDNKRQPALVCTVASALSAFGYRSE